MSEPHEQQVHDFSEVEVRLNAAVLELLSSHTNLSSAESRIIMYVLACMDPYTGIASLTRNNVADHVRVSPSFVSRATTKLKELGLLWRIDNDHLQVNPHFGFRGETREAWGQAVEALPGDAPAIRISTPKKPASSNKSPSCTRKSVKPHLRLVK